VHPGNGLIYQVADDSHLYVLSPADRACVGTYYLGHEPGSIISAPVFAQDLMLLTENRLRGGVLRACRLETDQREPAPIQALALDGDVYQGPIEQSGWIAVATDRAKVYTFRIDPQHPEQPLAPGPVFDGAATLDETMPSEESIAQFAAADAPRLLPRLTIAGDRLHVAADRLFELPWPPPASGDYIPLRTTGLSGPALQCAAWHDGARVTFAPGPAGDVVVAAHHGETALWQTSLGVTIAGTPRFDASAQAVCVLTTTGAAFSVPVADFEQGAIVRGSPAARLADGMTMPADSRTLAVNDACTAFSPGAGYDFITLALRTDVGLDLEAVRLPAALACHAQALGGFVVALLADGRFVLVHATTRQVHGQTYPADAWPAGDGSWHVGSSESGLSFHDGAGRGYEVRIDVDDGPRLQVETIRTAGEALDENPPTALHVTEFGWLDAEGMLVRGPDSPAAVSLAGGEPLAGEPIDLGGRLLIVGSGGCLHLVVAGSSEAP
jgi:hypothetical protein